GGDWAERGNLGLRCERRSRKWKNHEGESTEAETRGGTTRSSEEVPETGWSEGVVMLIGCPAGPSAGVHRNLCAAGKRNEVRDFGVGFGENGLSRGRCNSENRTDSLNYGRHQPSETGARNTKAVHNSGYTSLLPGWLR